MESFCFAVRQCKKMIKHRVFFFAGSEVCGEGRVKRPERDRAFLAWFFFPLEKEVEVAALTASTEFPFSLSSPSLPPPPQRLSPPTMASALQLKCVIGAVPVAAEREGPR